MADRTTNGTGSARAPQGRVSANITALASASVSAFWVKKTSP
jgi:hypothetical protein